MYQKFLRKNPQLYNKLAHYDVWETLERDGLEKISSIAADVCEDDNYITSKEAEICKQAVYNWLGY